MRRDRDRIRDLLVRLEAAPTGHIELGGVLNVPQDERVDEYHLMLMADESLVTGDGEGQWRLTAVGHDAVEALNQNDLWERLKKAGPKEAYDLLKGAASSLAVTALSKVMGWG